MSQRYHAEKEDGAYAWLDEFLCEYVDGTMDPAARMAFEEYLRANAQLWEHVQRLSRARQMLCRYGACRAPLGFQSRLRSRLACEMGSAHHPALPRMAERLGVYATWASAMIVMLIVGMLAGATLLSETPHPRSAAEATLFPAHNTTLAARPRTMTPLWWARDAQVRLALSGPATPLPAYARPGGFMNYPDHPDTAQAMSLMQRSNGAP